MTHPYHHGKMDKKRPQHTAKEKRMAKRMKKHHVQEQQANEMSLHLTPHTTQH